MRRRQLLPVAILVIGLASSACSWQSPDVDLDIPVEAETSRVYASDGTLITSLHAEEDRELVPLRRIPKLFRQAVVAVEDERFWDHRGVDVRAIARAAKDNAESGGIVQGGSTITQQYVKNALVGDDRNLRRKVKEASLAYQLEQRFTKERILELYLNSIYFGNGAYGASAASQEYFGAPVESLDLPRSALLAGVIRSPNRYDPFDHPDVATARRKVVLDKMVSLGLIGVADAEAAHAAPLGLRTPATTERYAAPHFVERVKRLILDDPRFGKSPKARRDLLFRGGLKIYTTLDLAKQAAAEHAVNLVLSKPATDPSAGVVTIDPQTGQVKALVGGRDFFGGGADAKFDLATQGRRPAGSAFKPFVLAKALDKGIPVHRVYPAPRRLILTLDQSGGTWVVNNYEGSGGGAMDLVEATVNSVNTVYAQLIMDVGPAEAIKTAADMGVKSPLKPFPSAVLGTNDVTVLDMASGYATLANRGLYVTPSFVTRVVARNGEVIYAPPKGQKRVLPAAVVAAEVDVLRQVVERGTAVNANIGRPVAGKTGTGQQWRDAWFVGFTPDLVTAVWVGFPDRQRSMLPPATRIRVTGGSWPAQIWQLYMSAALAQSPIAPFPEAPPLVPTTVPPDVVTDDGPRQILENVIGMPAAEAQALLERSGLRVVTRVVANAEYPPNYAVAMSPRPGSKVRQGATVTLSISRAAYYSSMPDVLGMSRADAEATIRQVGLIPRATVADDPTSSPDERVPGQVWKQNPASGTSVESGATVKIWVNT